MFYTILAAAQLFGSSTNVKMSEIKKMPYYSVFAQSGVIYKILHLNVTILFVG